MPASPPYAAPSQFDATQFHSEFGYLAPTIRFRRKVALTLKGGALGALVGAVAVFVVVMNREEKAFTMLSTPVQTIPASSTPVLSTQAPSPSVASAPAKSAQTPFPRTASAPASPAPVVAMPMSSKPGAPAQEPPTRTAAAPVPSAPVAAAPASLTPVRAAAINSAQVRFVPEASALPAAVPADPEVRGPAPPAVAVGPFDLVPGAIAGAPVKAAAKPKKKIVREPQPERTVRSAPVEPGSRSAYAAEPSVPRFFRSIFSFGQ